MADEERTIPLEDVFAYIRLQHPEVIAEAIREWNRANDQLQRDLGEAE